MNQEKEIRLTQTDPAIPGWFAALMQTNGWKYLTLVLEKEKITFRESIDFIESMYLGETDEKTAAVLLCTILSDDTAIADLLKADGVSVWNIPECFSFLNNPIKGLDVCFGLVIPLDAGGYYGEQFVIRYNDVLELIPGFLSLDKVCLKILKQGASAVISLTGMFQTDNAMCFSVCLDITSEQITGRLGTPTGKFPSMMEFLTWIGKQTGGVRQEIFGWLQDSEKILKAVLSNASLTIGLETRSIEDYILEFCVTLWGMEFALTFYGAAQILQGSLWERKKILLKDLWGKLAADTPLPKELEEMELSDCFLEINLAEKACKLHCCVEKVCTVAGFALEEITLSLLIGEKKQIDVSGQMTIQNIWNCSMELCFTDKDACQINGRLSLSDTLNLDGIPLLSYIFPNRADYQAGGIGFHYENGRLTGADVSFSYRQPKKEQQELTPQYHLEQSGNGTFQMIEEQSVPECGALRAEDGIRWKEIRKKTGPVVIERIGTAFDDWILWTALEAGMEMGPVRVDVTGMMIGYDLQGQKLLAKLSGLGVSCKTSVFSLAGTMMKDTTLPEDVKESYSGSLTVKMGRWKLAAGGSYAVMKNGTDSLFIFLNCSMILAVMPAIQITAIMGGIGMNRKLRIPKAREVENFPLLSADMEEGQVQKALNQWIVPAKGEYWAAAGIHFTACGLVKGKILLSLLFGQEFQAALLGSAEVTLPKGTPEEKAYARIIIFLSALLRPEQGSFCAEASLGENSFLLDHNCHVFGQAACSVWFGHHANAGDFVLTLGGYHPSYRPPAHYPKVNSVGFSWQVDKHLSAKGSVYLALTPACVMAGGNLEFLFTSGNLKAWFKAYLHLLLNWHPFFFEGQIGVQLGISYRLNLLFCHKTIKITLGGELSVWGPPLGGKLKIHLSFLQFTISFGKKQEAGKRALSWREMRETLLPGESLHSMEALDGIRNQKDEKEPWLCAGGTLKLRCRTAVPAGTIQIRPMQSEQIQSGFKISVVSPDQKTGTLEQFGLEAEEETSSLPAALWGKPEKSLTASGERLVKGCTGYLIRTKKAEFSGEIQIPDFREALIQCLTLPNPLTAAALKEDTEIYGDETTDTIEQLKTIDGKEAVEKRGKIAQSLYPYYNGAGGSFTQTQKNREHLYMDCPRYRKQVGE